MSFLWFLGHISRIVAHFASTGNICNNKVVPLSLLHLNIQGAVRFDDVIAYIKKYSFDIVQLQEVAGGSFSKSVHNDTFIALKEHLMGYEGVLAKSFDMQGESASYDGNATFYKQSIKVLKSDSFAIQPFASVRPFSLNDLDWIRALPRTVLSILVEHDGDPVWFVNAHLAWGPNAEDEPEKIRQAEIFKEYLDKLEEVEICVRPF